MSESTPTPVPNTDAPIPPSPTKSARRRKPCAICGKEARDARAFGMIRPAVAQAMLADHPDLTANSIICGKHASPYRSRYVTEMLARERGELSDLEKQVVESLASEETVSENIEEEYEDERTFGERAADEMADFGGSWNFIVAFGACWSSGWPSTSGRRSAPSIPTPSSCSTWCCPAWPPSRRRSS